MTPETKKEIVKILQQKGVSKCCSRCASYDFVLLDGYFNQALQERELSSDLGTTYIPSVIIICRDCGHMSQYALGILGLLPKNDANEE